MREKVYVFYAKIPDKIGDNKIFYDRRKEVCSSSSYKVKLEKYWSWVLLERAFILAGFNGAAESAYKSSTGKWLFHGVCGSISHSRKIVAVAVSTVNCGVDVQAFVAEEFTAKLANKILTDAEAETYACLPLSERPDFVASAWSKKESIFKMLDDGRTINKICASDYIVRSEKLTVDGETYYLSFSADKDVEFVIDCLQL